MNEDTSESTEHDLVVRGLEAVKVSAFAKSLLLLQSGLDVVQFELDLRVVSREGSKTAESLGSFLLLALHDQETGRLEV